VKDNSISEYTEFPNAFFAVLRLRCPFICILKSYVTCSNIVKMIKSSIQMGRACSTHEGDHK
jgi:hypothetical protein